MFSRAGSDVSVGTSGCFREGEISERKLDKGATLGKVQTVIQMVRLDHVPSVSGGETPMWWIPTFIT